MRILSTVLWSILLALNSGLARAEDSPIVQEKVVRIPSLRDPQVQLETTLFDPPALEHGRAPVVVINHGTNGDAPQPEPRYVPVQAINFFIEQGMSVVLPNRRGRAASGGKPPVLKDCDITAYSLEAAADIDDAVQWVAQQPEYRGRPIVVLGQSTGGSATMAYSSLATNLASAVINFHGGLRPRLGPTDCKWEARVKAFAAYAPTSRPKSLWIYTANDHSSNPPYIKRLHETFEAAGGHAVLHQLPAFKEDGHYLLTDPEGRAIWGPLVLEYLQAMGVRRR